MTQLSSNRTARRGRVFPERQLSPEEKAKRQSEDEVFAQRCRVIFEQVRPMRWIFQMFRLTFRCSAVVM